MTSLPEISDDMETASIELIEQLVTKGYKYLEQVAEATTDEPLKDEHQQLLNKYVLLLIDDEFDNGDFLEYIRSTETVDGFVYMVKHCLNSDQFKDWIITNHHRITKESTKMAADNMSIAVPFGVAILQLLTHHDLYLNIDGWYPHGASGLYYFVLELFALAFCDNNASKAIWSGLSRSPANLVEFVDWVTEEMNGIRGRNHQTATANDFVTGMEPSLVNMVILLIAHMIHTNELDLSSLDPRWLRDPECKIPWYEKEVQIEDGVPVVYSLETRLGFLTIHALEVGMISGFRHASLVNAVLQNSDGMIPPDVKSKLENDMRATQGGLYKVSQYLQPVVENLFRWGSKDLSVVPNSFYNMVASCYELCVMEPPAGMKLVPTDESLSMYAQIIGSNKVHGNFRRLMTLSLSSLIRDGGVHPDHKNLVGTLFGSVIRLYNETVSESDISHWKYTGTFRALIRRMTSRPAYGSLVESYCADHQREMMRFCNSLFSDVIYIGDRLSEHFKQGAEQSDDFFSTITTIQKCTQLAQVLNRLLAFIRLAMNMEPVRTLIHSQELNNRMAGSIIHTLSVLYIEGKTVLSMTGTQNGLVSVVVNLMNLIHQLKDDPILIEAMAEHQDYNYELMSDIFSFLQMVTMQSGNEETSIQLMETISALDYYRIEKEKKDLEKEEMIDDPDEFLDPLLSTVIEHPVVIPTSKPLVADKFTISEWLLTTPNDPFNKQPLTFDQVLEYNETKEAKKILTDFLERRDQARKDLKREHLKKTP